MAEKTTPSATQTGEKASEELGAESVIRFHYASAPLLPATVSVDLTALAEAALARSRSGTLSGPSA
ncbi:hypothetical protein GCM10027568_31840 [Humibacter soli]